MHVGSHSLWFAFLPLLLVAASGCAATRWSVVDGRPVMAIHVAAAETQGPVDHSLVAHGRASMIGELRARGYQVMEQSAPGVPTLQMKVVGALFDDSKLHAPDDARHNIVNDLHYAFVAYTVRLALVDDGGRIFASGIASSDGDPATAVAELTAHLVHDVPSVASTIAAR